MLETIIIVLLILVIITQNIVHFFERRDMINRIVGKNFSFNHSHKPPEHIPSAHDRVLQNWKNKVGDK
jgi:hypothetical protein